MLENVRNQWLSIILILIVVSLGAAYLKVSSPQAPPPTATDSSAPLSPTLSPSAANLTIYRSDAPLPLQSYRVVKLGEVVKVKMQTTQGDLLIDVYPLAAPNAAKRFMDLVKAGFYDNTPIFRIVPGFVAQFGINSAPTHKPWMDKNFRDDASLFCLEPGTLAFAKAGPDTNSTQVFINYAENSQMLAPQNFTTFAKIVQGYENTLKFKQVGSPDMGLDQGRLRNDTGYLKSLPQQPDMIVKAEILP